MTEMVRGHGGEVPTQTEVKLMMSQAFPVFGEDADWEDVLEMNGKVDGGMEAAYNVMMDAFPQITMAGMHVERYDFGEDGVLYEWACQNSPFFQSSQNSPRKIWVWLKELPGN